MVRLRLEGIGAFLVSVLAVLFAQIRHRNVIYK
jgi:hypothetical protein